MPLASLLVFVASAAAETWPAGAVIEQAAYADITPEGFDAVAALVPGFIPTSIPIDAMSGGDDGAWGQCWLGGYEYGLSGANVGITVTSTDIVPADGVLNLTTDLLVQVNSSSSPFELYTEFECIGDTCSGYVDAFPVNVNLAIGLAVVTGDTGQPVLDATVGTPQLTYSIDSSSIHLDDCAIGTVEDVLNVLGLSLYDLILGQLDGYLDDAVADFGPEIEQTLEEAFSAATVSQELDVNGAVVNLNLFPSDVQITPAGARIRLSGAMDGGTASCVAAYDPGGSLKTLTDAPVLGQSPSGVDSPFHVGLSFSDDFFNQALYALWRGGLLCYTMGPDGSFPLDTSILNLLTGDAFVELFPESKPLTLRTVPRAPPTAAFDAGYDVGLALDDLDVEFYAELDGRQARMLDVSLDGVTGANLAFDGNTGAMAVEVALEPDDLTPSVVYNEIVPEANDAILASFTTQFGALLDTVLGGMLGDLAFSLPTTSGIGLQDLQTGPAGSAGDWLGAYAWIGAVPYTSSEGCGSDSGCGGGCAVGGTSVPAPPFWVAAAALLLRRRRDRS